MAIVWDIADQVETHALQPVPASAITDARWLRAQIDAAARRYRLRRLPALGVLWWYSASSVLLGPPVDGFDPALSCVTLYLHPDGRILDARSDSLLDNDTMGQRLSEALSVCVEAVTECTGASRRALWAIATDSLANRALWAGLAPGLAERLALAVGPALPMPRYITVSGRLVVRRASCCLVYEAPGQSKCTSCPRQTPEERLRRLSNGG